MHLTSVLAALLFGGTTVIPGISLRATTFVLLLLWSTCLFSLFSIHPAYGAMHGHPSVRRGAEANLEKLGRWTADNVAVGELNRNSHHMSAGRTKRHYNRRRSRDDEEWKRASLKEELSADLSPDQLGEEINLEMEEVVRSGSGSDKSGKSGSGRSSHSHGSGSSSGRGSGSSSGRGSGSSSGRGSGSSSGRGSGSDSSGGDQSECDPCRSNSDCKTNLCYSGKCIFSNLVSKARCFPGQFRPECSPCFVDKECSQGKCWGQRCTDGSAPSLRRCFNPECAPCRSDFDCSTKKCESGKCVFPTSASRTKCSGGGVSKRDLCEKCKKNRHCKSNKCIVGKCGDGTVGTVKRCFQREVCGSGH